MTPCRTTSAMSPCWTTPATATSPPPLNLCTRPNHSQTNPPQSNTAGVFNANPQLLVVYVDRDCLADIQNVLHSFGLPLLFQHQLTLFLSPHSWPELAPYLFQAQVHWYLQRTRRRSIMPSLLASALASIGMSGLFHFLWSSVWLTCTSHLSRDNVLPLISNVLGAHYRGFVTLEAAKDFYLGAKRLGKIQIVRNPGDDQVFGPRGEAIQ